jgi:hypothetical protein
MNQCLVFVVLAVVPLLAIPSPSAAIDTTASSKYHFKPPSSSLLCRQETNVPNYSSTYNKTALLQCINGTRPEKMCIVGAGSSGIHMGWLLKRRGFVNTVVYERRNRTGGDIWTWSPPPPPTLKGSAAKDINDGITRELGAAFLSPDYDEVRGLLKRFRLPEVPISVKKEMDFHSNNETMLASSW